MVPAQAKAQILQRATDARKRDNMRNKQNKARHRSSLTDHGPNSSSFRPFRTTQPPA